MLKWAIILGVVSHVAWFFGFSGVSAATATFGQVRDYMVKKAGASIVLTMAKDYTNSPVKVIEKAFSN